MKVCELKSLTEDYTKFDVKELSDILQTKRSLSFYEMRALNCFFKTFGNKIVEYITQEKKIEIETLTGNVNIVELFGHNQVVVKVAKNKYDEDEIKREYSLGMNHINKLRQFVPNFVYTLGKIKRNNNFYLLLEKINGIECTRLNRKQRIKCLCMLIIALSKAEELIKFSHKDLHVDNLIIKENIFHEYQVNIGTRSYNIKTDFIPVIIDFGQSDVKNNIYNQNVINTYYRGYDVYQLFQTLDLLDLFKEYYGFTFSDYPNDLNTYNINPLNVLHFLLKYEPEGIIVKDRDEYIHYDSNITNSTYNKLFMLKKVEQAKSLLNCSKFNNIIDYEHCRYIIKKFGGKLHKKKIKKKYKKKNYTFQEILNSMYKSKEMNKFTEIFESFQKSHQYLQLRQKEISRYS